MTYCSEILKQKETEIQQLKKERDEWKSHYEDACFDCYRKKQIKELEGYKATVKQVNETNRSLLDKRDELWKQVEAAKTILNEYYYESCTCSICLLSKKILEVLEKTTK